MSRYVIAVILCLLFASCRPDTYAPKPPGYYKIDLPKHDYQQFSDPRFPYTFVYPTYAHIVRDTSFFGKKPENPYWINIEFPSLGGTIYVSYKEISPKQTYAKLLEDAHNLSFFHTKKADYIDDYTFHNGNGVSGVFYNVGGDAASAYQFIATDSIKHFIRGALYFDVSPNADSLKPVNEFLKADIDTLLQSLKWQ
jgi:gliding motility-associated lipoprotein GldD